MAKAIREDKAQVHRPLFKRRRASLIWSWRIWTQSRGPGSFSILFAVQYFSVNTSLRQWCETKILGEGSIQYYITHQSTNKMMVMVHWTTICIVFTVTNKSGCCFDKMEVLDTKLATLIINGHSCLECRNKSKLSGVSVLCVFHIEWDEMLTRCLLN